MPYPFDSIMNETGSTSSKSITSSAKSISIDYEINDVAANHPSPTKQRLKYRHQHEQIKKHKQEVHECAKKLTMVDHLSGSTESTKDNNSNDGHSNNNDNNDFYMNSLVYFIYNN